MSQACARNDLLGRNVSWLLWRVPLLVFVVGLFLETVPRTLLWTPAFLVAGTACLVNASRCGRIHCYVTGPLYLLAATATVLRGLGMLAMPWAVIAFGVPAGTVAAYAVERALGKYRSAS